MGGADAYHGLGQLKQLSTEAFKVLQALHPSAGAPTYLCRQAGSSSSRQGAAQRTSMYSGCCPIKGMGPPPWQIKITGCGMGQSPRSGGSEADS